MVATEARVRRAHEPVEVVAPTAEPGEAEQREQRAAERRLAEPRRALDRVRDAEPGERRLERRAPALQRGCDDRDVSGIRAAADQLEDLLAHELEHAASTRRLEKAHGPLEGRSGRVTVDEQPALEMRKRGPHVAIGRSRKLLDAPGSLLGQRRSRPLERGEREPPGLVRERDGDVGAAREPLDERPLRRGEILESVRVDGTAVPRVEIAGHAVRRVAPLTIAVPPLEPVELVAIRAQKVARARLEVFRARQAPTRAPRCVAPSVSAKPEKRDVARARRRSSSPRWASVSTARWSPLPRAMPANRSSNVPTEPPTTRLAARDEIPLDALNLRPVRDDEHRLPRDVRRIAVEQEGDLAGVRRPREQCQRHATQSRAGGAPSYASRGRYAAADFGRRPRRATVRPGCLPAQLSQRSACSRAAPRIGVRDPHRGALLLLDLGSTHVADENRLLGHRNLLSVL